MPNYIAALNSTGALRLPDRIVVRMTGLPTRAGPADVRWFTRYSDEGYAALVPRELWVEVSGEMPDFDTARVELTELGRVLSPVLALSANAALADPELELAYESTSGVASRDFMQVIRTTDTGIPNPTRLIDPDTIAPLVNAIFGASESDRLHRATVQYGETLKAWSPGQHLRAVTHLWMAVEALTKAAQRIEQARLGVDQDGLLANWGIAKEQLDAAVRRRVIFHGDGDVYAETKSVSDATEHGFGNLAELHPRAVAVRDAAAGHVRRAILELLDIGPELRRVLLAPPFDRPKESYAFTNYLRGRLVGEGDQLAAGGQPYPFAHATTSIAEFSQNEDGSYTVRPTTNYLFALGPGISLTEIRHEVWSPPTVPVSAVAEPAPDDQQD